MYRYYCIAGWNALDTRSFEVRDRRNGGAVIMSREVLKRAEDAARLLNAGFVPTSTGTFVLETSFRETGRLRIGVAQCGGGDEEEKWSVIGGNRKRRECRDLESCLEEVKMRYLLAEIAEDGARQALLKEEQAG